MNDLTYILERSVRCVQRLQTHDMIMSWSSFGTKTIVIWRFFVKSKLLIKHPLNRTRIFPQYYSTIYKNFTRNSFGPSSFVFSPLYLQLAGLRELKVVLRNAINKSLLSIGSWESIRKLITSEKFSRSQHQKSHQWR